MKASNNTQTGVKCNVSNCAYFKNNYCSASEIEVDNQNGITSSTSQETICSTFRPKNG